MSSGGRTLRSYLDTIAKAEAFENETWAPDDPRVRAELHDQIFMNLAQGYFMFMGSSPEQPDLTPMYNSALRLQPNPDDTYVRTVVNGNGIYRLSGERGTIRLLTVTLAAKTIGTQEKPGGQTAEYDLDETITFNDDGTFECIFSDVQPDGHLGNWLRMPAETDMLLVRRRSYDWGNERDPRLAIERLDASPLRARPSLEETEATLVALSEYAERHSRQWLQYQKLMPSRGIINKIEHHGFTELGGIRVQTYWWGMFQLEPGEALILETEVPDQARYWNVQLNDEIWNTLEYRWRQSSLNGHQARVDVDGKFRAVISPQDPGVPNWLDTVERLQGSIVGRWYQCETNPVPRLTKIKLSELRSHLPPETPYVSVEERDTALRDRGRSAQMRIRW